MGTAYSCKQANPVGMAPSPTTFCPLFHAVREDARDFPDQKTSRGNRGLPARMWGKQQLRFFQSGPCVSLRPVLYFRYAMRKELTIMARFVPKDKLSKKAQKELNRQRRTMWDLSPVSRAVESRKLYNRKRNARNRDDYGLGDFFISRLLCHRLLS